MGIGQKLKGQLNRVRRWFLFGDRANTNTYIRRMNRSGARIDESVKMSVPESVLLDQTSPWMLEIGKNVYISEDVKILTHDASWLVMAGEDGVVRGHVAPVKIGNNVFLGARSMVLCNVKICDHVIVAAGAVVSSSIRKPGVYAGNPAKLVITLDQLKAVRDSRQLKEALTLAREYYHSFQKLPPREIFDEYFWLFEKRDADALPQYFKRQMCHSGNEKVCMQEFLHSEPEFDGFEAFLKWCEEKICRE